MSKINKLITNKPVTLTEEEVTNLSKTLSAVQTAGGGGGGGGRVYYGDGTTVSVNQIDGIISLTTEATEKLNTPVPTKVSDLTDYADYQTVDMMSAYLTTAVYSADSATYVSNDELQNVFSFVMGKIPSAVSNLTDSANYQLTADMSAYGTKDWIGGQGYLTKLSGDLYYTPLPDGLSDEQYYAMTNSGWKVIQGGGGQGGISTVAHDSSLTGNGNSENLGIKTDAALNLTNVSAYSAQKAEIAFNYWDPTASAPLNIADEFANKVDKPDTTQESLSNKYLIYSTLTGTGAVTGWTDFNANVYSKSESDGRYQKKEDMGSYLTTAQYETDSATFVTSSSNTITGDAQYALTTTGWAEVQAGSTFTGVETTGAISGTGIAGSEIGLVKSATSALDLINDQYQIDGSQYITVVPNTATKKVVIGLDNQVSNAIDTVTANANIWNNASAVSAKSHTTIDNTTNIITTENQGTSASLSAVEYKDNVNVAGMNVQQIYAVRSDGDIFACLSTTANKGTLFFVCSGV